MKTLSIQAGIKTWNFQVCIFNTIFVLSWKKYYCNIFYLLHFIVISNIVNIPHSFTITNTNNAEICIYKNALEEGSCSGIKACMQSVRLIVKHPKWKQFQFLLELEPVGVLTYSLLFMRVLVNFLAFILVIASLPINIIIDHIKRSKKGDQLIHHDHLS